MINVLIAIHVLCTIAIIGLVLIQHGKGADAGAAFGGGGGGASGSLFGSQGSANFLSRTTAVVATVFFLTSLSLTYLYSHSVKPRSVTETMLESPVESPPADEAQSLPEIPADSSVPESNGDIPVIPDQPVSDVNDKSVSDNNSDQTGSDVPAIPAEQTEEK